MSSIDRLLNSLDGIKKIGPGKYKALCPAHSEKTPSLHIKELNDDRIIMHCFGCGANGVEICQALGIDIDVLFPEKLEYEKEYKRERKPFNANEILAALAHEAIVISIAANKIINGEKIGLDDAERIGLAANRIMSAVDYVNS